MDIVDHLLDNKRSNERLQNVLSELMTSIQVSEDGITLVKGQASIQLLENGTIRFIGYSARQNDMVGVTLDQILNLLPYVPASTGDV